MTSKNTIVLITLCFMLAGFIVQGHAYDLYDRVGIASSPNPVGSGARAIGMGGAFIGIADDATAASWNPAGLIQLEKSELSIVGAYNVRTEDYASSTNPEADNTSTIDETNLNYLSATLPFNLLKRNMVVSVNYQRLYEFKRELEYDLTLSTPSIPPLSSEQNRNYEMDGYLGALGVAYTAEITPRLSIGGTLNVWTDDLFWQNGWKENFKSHSDTTFGASHVLEDTDITETYKDFSGVNVNIGIMWNVFRNFTIGAVIKTPFTASVKKKYSEDWVQKDATTGAIIDSDKIRDSEDIDVDMPISYGLGLAWRVSDRFSLDLDVYRTEWSDYVITDSAGNKTAGIGGRADKDSDVDDTTQVRFGGEYLIIRPDQSMVIPIRGGIFYDPEPTYDGKNDFYGISLGSGIGYKRFIFDIAYQLRWGRDVETDNLIANSEADVTQHTVLLSVIYHF
ncbi:MAG: outer membrane protein transport protein [Deltaproteobacteria bacterium]|nr:outer membrane protein transport protein [Deltaproteobacteria bacterium]